MPGENLDLPHGPEAGRPGPETTAAPFLGVHFACCRVYSRIYATKDRTAYLGHCPRCGRRVTARVGKDDTNARFFTAY